ncbi:hypothetical protein PTSG_11399 [Salpingoeca rosetta]|uniref:Uncharacterized protein n=1 Tax=Salpingoeca rosetta (strain ATCC 50818 / BSB-021) TaxID=946362 RepID=F2UTB0_SALR5|nr:uncharacterized protein PTSG_11399 [Salpingoeca rosetta]EGD81866.1 hypothetical protein PTSG_11399 [Salpingoeca rosetta]|eukprot:XP_004987596.1 hypothetical protein PTSG_11399 [Salpingoeca rosetta]
MQRVQVQHVQQLLGHSSNGQHQLADHVHHHHVHHVHVQQDSVQHHQHHYQQQQHQHHQQSVFQQGQERLLHDDGRPARKRAHLSLSFAQQVYLAQQHQQQRQHQHQQQQQQMAAAAQAYTAPAPPFQAVQPMLAQAATQAGQHGQRDQPSLPQQASLEQQQKRKRRLAKKKDTEQTRRDAIRAHVNELRRIVLPENASAILRWSYQAVVMTCAVYAFTKADPGFFELANMHRQRVRKELLTAAFVRQVLPECAHADACTTPSQRRLQALTGDNKRTEYEGIVYDRLAALVSPEENEHARILRAARDRITSDGCRLTEQELIEVAELLGERKQG